jgi:ribosome-associated protein
MPPTLVICPGVIVPSAAMTASAVRSSGPGGQNVNKVSSKIDLRVDLTAISGLCPDARTRLRALAAPRLDGEGRLYVTSQKTRDRAKNLEDALDKVRALITLALVAPVRRRPTRPTRGSIERRLTAKREASQRKADRRRDD